MAPFELQQLEPELQEIAVDDYHFRNWAKTFTCKPELLFSPQTEKQVQKVVKQPVKKKFLIFKTIFFRLFYWQIN